MKTLEEVKFNQKMILELLRNQQKSTETHTNSSEEFEFLPLKNHQQALEMEEKLKEKKYKDQFVS